MSNKLTASVMVDRGTYLACAKSGGQRLDLGVIWQYDHRDQAYQAGNIFKEAIAQHDAAVNAELIGERDRLKAILVGVHETLRSRGFVECAADLRAAIAEVEKSDA